jgi:cation diffusion facilitator family transporter
MTLKNTNDVHSHPHVGDQAHPHEHDHPHDEAHDHPHPHPHEGDHAHPHDHEHPHDHDHSHDEAHDHPHPHDEHGRVHAHGHDHGHDHSHGAHDHHHGSGVWGWISTIFHLHGHSHQHDALVADTAFTSNEEGIRTVWIALAALAITSILQIIIVWLSGSVALFADTVHNIGDALNSIPLLIAFYLARRAATRRYTYGFARAEDVAGVLIVLSIAFSAGVIFYESFRKLLYPEPLTHLGWLALAAVIGFVGNEIVAMLQIRVGRKIGSAAMVADGMHARTDGFTSLAVLIAVGGSWLGYPIVDPIVGILIGITILFITWDAVKSMWYRLMDAIEPEHLERAEAVIREQPELKELRWLRMRWMGHRLHADIGIAVDPHLTTAESHHIAEHLRHDLFHALPYLSEVLVHVDPWSAEPEKHHELTAHHEEQIASVTA